MLTLTPPIRSWLTSMIDGFADDRDQPEYLRLHASRNSVLPLYVDWTGFWGLRADGEILLVFTEQEQEPVVEMDDRIRRIALFQGAKRYSELSPLVPQRPSHAYDCPHCLGTGVIDLPDVGPDVIICYCGGLGWLV